MTVFPSVFRTKSWTGLVLAFVLILLFYETLVRLDRFPQIRDAGPEFIKPKDEKPKDEPSIDASKTTKKGECEIINRMRRENITVVMRTGATEAYEKLPIQLLTVLRCFEPQDILFYSDLADDMGQFEITDILSTIPESKKKANKDFDIYYEIQHYKETKQDFKQFPNEKTEGTGDWKAWTLDKYKFLHVLEEAYRARPESKWFVFMEADTYYFWGNLLLWLKSLDSSQELYYGSVAQFAGNNFGHGGSGFIMSRPALTKLLVPDRGLAASWDEKIKNECCGDLVIGMEMEKAGVKVKQAHPMFNGEYPESMEFGPGKSWCQPLITMHHIPPNEITPVWRWEQEQNHENPILISDIFSQFVSPQMATSPTRTSWDNLAKDVIYRPTAPESLTELERNAHVSPTTCELACKADTNCFQYLWKSGKVNTTKTEMTDLEDLPNCGFGNVFRLGKFRADVVEEDWKEQWVSGWDVDKISKWVDVNKCKEPEWVI